MFLWRNSAFKERKWKLQRWASVLVLSSRKKWSSNPGNFSEMTSAKTTECRTSTGKIFKSSARSKRCIWRRLCNSRTSKRVSKFIKHSTRQENCATKSLTISGIRTIWWRTLAKPRIKFLQAQTTSKSTYSWCTANQRWRWPPVRLSGGSESTSRNWICPLARIRIAENWNWTFKKHSHKRMATI